MVYDPVRKRMILYNIGALWQLSMDTFTWEHLTVDGVGPDAREDARLAYDPIADRILLFGGFSISPQQNRNDLWSLDLSPTVPVWSELHAVGDVPPARFFRSFAFDPDHRRGVVFGGEVNNAEPLLDDTWQVSLATTPPTWSRVTTTLRPPARIGHTMIYDRTHGRVLVIAGADTYHGNWYNDVWALTFTDSARWQPLAPAGEAPMYRMFATTAFDPANDRVLMFGGLSFDTHSLLYLNDGWALSLKHDPAWAPTGWSGTPPIGREYPAGAFDADKGRFVVFGGYNAGFVQSWFSDTWHTAGGGYAMDLAVAEPGAGIVNRSLTAACYPPESQVTITAVPAPDFTFAGWDGDASGTSNPLVVTLDGYKSIVAHFAPATTATLLAQFEAIPARSGIELRWRWGAPDRVATVSVERAETASGPWLSATVEMLEEGDVTIARDYSVEPAREYWFRLRVVLNDGSTATFGPILARAATLVLASAIAGVGPNPITDVTQIQLAIAVGGPVRLTAWDLAGREVDTLFDATLRPGGYTVSWDSKRFRAGTYFLRLAAPDGAVTRRVAIIR